MKLPLTLFALSLVSFFPEIAQEFSDRLAFLMPAHRLLLPAASWLARYEAVGALSLASGAFLVYKRLNRRHEKKLL